MTSKAPARERLTRLAGRIQGQAERSLALWLDAGLDPRGGAHGFLDRHFRPQVHCDGDPPGPSREWRGDQSLVQQSRHLFAYSLAHQRRCGDERVASFAHQLYHHLQEGLSREERAPNATIPDTPRARVLASEVTEPSVHLTTAEGPAAAPAGYEMRPQQPRRPFYNWVPRGGAPWGAARLASDLASGGRDYEAPASGADFLEQSPYSPFAVQLYSQGFAVYALATYALVFDLPGAAQHARELFLLLDAARHDDEFGGYDQSADGGWMSFVEAPDGAAKCTNTHIHLLEALTPLCLCYPDDPRVSGRLKELARLIVEVLQQPSGYVHKFFARDGAPLGAARVSYGHDLETSWLLLDALDALQKAGCLDTETAALVQAGSRKMALHALRTGWDEAGGMFDEGVPEGASEAPRVINRDKVWWAQAEALPAIFKLYQQTHELEFLRYLEETFEFLAEKSWDAEGGEYFWGVDSEGSHRGRGDHKGEMWKTPYHALRACLITADWIREHLRDGTFSRPHR